MSFTFHSERDSHQDETVYTAAYEVLHNTSRICEWCSEPARVQETLHMHGEVMVIPLCYGCGLNTVADCENLSDFMLSQAGAGTDDATAAIRAVEALLALTRDPTSNEPLDGKNADVSVWRCVLPEEIHKCSLCWEASADYLEVTPAGTVNRPCCQACAARFLECCGSLVVVLQQARFFLRVEAEMLRQGLSKDEHGFVSISLDALRA